MSDQDLERSFGFAKIAINQLMQNCVPAEPAFYELLYTYVKGTNQSLNDRLNALFMSGVQLTPLTAELLHKEFFEVAVSERVSVVSDRVAERINAVNGAIQGALETAQDFSTTLSSAWYDLDTARDASSVKEITRKLIVETERMQDDNSLLSAQLAASRDAIANMQRDLDEVRREAMLDPLTKLYNRARFDTCLIDAMHEARLAGTPLCLLLVDIDNFKAFNDSYGHLTGDQVLRLVAGQLQTSLEGKGIAARFGGEEFAAILPETDMRLASLTAEIIREAIQSKQLLRISTSERLGNLTASIGVAKFGQADSFASLVDRADACLYAAKRAGRNRVICEDELQTPRSVASSVA
ncbi:GGDEF domain-containing protein [Devosia sp. MC521]|uniref:GGDEF domain-containing protein n=1 Tax=Devosia sp. MC521 TaxID=2759954 RepID=UPI0015FE40B1|nr:GGDEF domain-containing protein [Devosia sp. MC521]MBJ6987047.1 GGDEF domain-containing protein [Devosia sp. MC521]QMW64065.1 GGDEF domain-containing protein [Devosia sp. MC521]